MVAAQNGHGLWFCFNFIGVAVKMPSNDDSTFAGHAGGTNRTLFERSRVFALVLTFFRTDFSRDSVRLPNRLIPPTPTVARTAADAEDKPANLERVSA
jgi:hypothetical protein